MLVDRAANDAIATANIANSFLIIDLKTRKLQPNYYSIRARNFNANHLKNWKFQASNDYATWIDLDTRALATALTSNQWFSAPINGQTTAYRFFRLLQTGLSSSADNVLTLGEIEMYGTLQGGIL